MHNEAAHGSLAQLYPILDASDLTPSLVRFVMVASVVVTDVWHTGSSDGHAAPDTIPLYPCRPNH